MLRSLVSTALLAATAAALPAQGIITDSLRPISLADAVKMAQQNSPSAVAARGQLKTTSSAVRSIYGGFLPSLSFSMHVLEEILRKRDSLLAQVAEMTGPEVEL